MSTFPPILLYGGRSPGLEAAGEKREEEEENRAAVLYLASEAVHQAAIPSHPHSSAISVLPFDSDNPDYVSKCHTCTRSCLAPAFSLPRTPFRLILPGSQLSIEVHPTSSAFKTQPDIDSISLVPPGPSHQLLSPESLQ